MKYVIFTCLLLNLLHVTAGQPPRHLQIIRRPQPAPDRATIMTINSVNQIQTPSNKR